MDRNLQDRITAIECAIAWLIERELFCWPLYRGSLRFEDPDYGRAMLNKMEAQGKRLSDLLMHRGDA